MVATVTEPPTPDAFLERLCLLALEVVREPRGASELEMAGVWAVLFLCLAGRASLAMMLIEAGDILNPSAGCCQMPFSFVGVRTTGHSGDR